jgi:hypothetical protein
MAWSPATPAPSTSTLAGASVPAAVVSIGSSLPSSPAPRSTALYPATVAWELRTSIDWARVMRGTRSRARNVSFRAASAGTSASAGSTSSIETRVAPSGASATSAGVGRRTRGQSSTPVSASAREGSTRAPAFS